MIPKAMGPQSLGPGPDDSKTKSQPQFLNRPKINGPQNEAVTTLRSNQGLPVINSPVPNNVLVNPNPNLRVPPPPLVKNSPINPPELAPKIESQVPFKPPALSNGPAYLPPRLGSNQDFVLKTLPPTYENNLNPLYVQEENPNNPYETDPNARVMDIVVEKPKYEEPPQYIPEKTLEEILSECVCGFCGQGQVNMILPECYHSCHLICFKANNFVCGCGKFQEVEGVNNSQTCKICSGKNNLISCANCRSNHCFLCIVNKDLAGCCEYLKNCLDQVKVSCPGCWSITSYSNIMPIKCKNHEVICMNCWNIGASQKKCVLGCEMPYELLNFCTCKACTLTDMKYCGNFKCPDHCEVCDFCQTQYSLKMFKEKRPLQCVYCGNTLVN